MSCVFFLIIIFIIRLCTQNSQSDALVFNFSNFSGGKVNLVDSFERSKLKIPGT